MSSRILPCQWEIGSGTSGWTLRTPGVPSYVSQNELGTGIQVTEAGFIQCDFPLPEALPGTPEFGDFSQIEEFRFWLRSSRPGDSSPGKPFYLIFELASDSVGASWRWFLPVKQVNVWEFHRLWLGTIREDLQPLRGSVSAIRLRTLEDSFSFTALLGDLLATLLEPLQDVDTTLLDRLDNRFQISDVPVPAIMDLPENPGDRSRPYLLITPWSVQPDGERGGSGDIIDNYWIDENGQTGACVRPPLWQVQLDYAIDAFADERFHKTYLLEQTLNSFSRQPFLVVNGERLAIYPFVPAPEEIAEFATPGRTPLFYRLHIQIETGDRQSQRQAVPFLVVGHQLANHQPDKTAISTEFVSINGGSS